MEGHGVHDPAKYVPRQLHAEWSRRDPIDRFRAWLELNAELTDDEAAEINEQVKRVLREASVRAEESPEPDPAELTDGVYADATDLDTPHFR